VEAVSAGRTSALRVRFGELTRFDAPTLGGDGTVPGWLTPRHALDQAFIDAAVEAGVTVIQPAQAHCSPRGASDGTIAVRCGSRRDSITLQARLVIGADGLRSAVAQSMGLARDKRRGVSRFGGKYGFSFAFRPRNRAAIDVGIIHMFVDRKGYLGVVSERDIMHAAGLVQGTGPISSRWWSSGNDEPPARDPFVFCRRMASTHPALAELGLAELKRDDVQRFVAAGPMPWPQPHIAGPNVALVGDAAGYVEPFTGEGMAWAIESAAALGEVIEALPPGEWTAAAANRYQQLWRTRIGARQRGCERVAAVLERPRLAGLAARAAAWHPALARRVVDRVVLSA
jgi:flavin-dependent dehydrogenase